MERVVHITLSFKEAEDWDRRQLQSMSPQQRIWAARVLQRRFFGPPKDIRQCREKN